MSLTERSMYGLVIIFFIFLTKAIYHLLYNYLEFNTKKKLILNIPIEFILII